MVWRKLIKIMRTTCNLSHFAKTPEIWKSRIGALCIHPQQGFFSITFVVLVRRFNLRYSWARPIIVWVCNHIELLRQEIFLLIGRNFFPDSFQYERDKKEMFALKFVSVRFLGSMNLWVVTKEWNFGHSCDKKYIYTRGDKVYYMDNV